MVKTREVKKIELTEQILKTSPSSSGITFSEAKAIEKRRKSTILILPDDQYEAKENSLRMKGQ